MKKKTNLLFILSIFIYLIKFTNIFSENKDNNNFLFENKNYIASTNDTQDKFIKKNLEVKPEDLDKITYEIIRKTYNKNKLFIITPYVEFGIRIPFWAYKGMMEHLSPFTNDKCTDLETFNFNEKESFMKALYLKPLDQINTPFAVNYGQRMTIGNIEDRTEDLYYSVMKVLKTTYYKEDKINFDEIYKSSNDVTIDATIENLKNLLSVADYVSKEFPLLGYIREIIFSSKDVINNFIVNKNKNVNLKPNLEQVLCPLYLVNISKFLFIKNAADNYILRRTERSLEKFNKITNNKYTIDDLIVKIKKNMKVYLDKPLTFFYNSELLNSDEILIPEVKKIFKEFIDNKIFKNYPNKEITIKQFINENIEFIIKHENDDNKKEEVDERKKILKSLRKIVNNLNYRTAENETFLSFELDTDFKEFIKNLKKSGLLPTRKPIKEYNKDNTKEININTNKQIARYNKKDLEVLFVKLVKVKKLKEYKEILKKLKIEDIKWWVPYNARCGIMGTYYFNTRVGINIDFSFSFSLTGMTKSLFLPEDFLQNAIFYLLKLHEPIVSGRILNEDKNIDDVYYAVPNLSITDLLMDDFFSKILKLKDKKTNNLVQDYIIGSKENKQTDAFSNYLNVINFNNDIIDCLCDIDVYLQQINFCIKFGIAVNLNKINNFNVNRNFILKNFINELSLNCGLYFNWQNLKIQVTENKQYYSDKKLEDGVKKSCVLQDVLEDAVIDALKNIEIDDVKNEKKINKGIEKMVYKIILNSFDSSVTPSNNKIIGFCNNIFENEIPEICGKTIFNTFTVRPVLDLKYKMISPIGLTFMCGCELIFLNPFNIYSNLNKFLNSFDGNTIKKNIKNFKIHKDFELLPYMSIGFSFSF